MFSVLHVIRYCLCDVFDRRDRLEALESGGRHQKIVSVRTYSFHFFILELLLTELKFLTNSNTLPSYTLIAIFLKIHK